MARAYDSDYRRGADYRDSYRRRPLPGYGRDYGAHDPEAGAYGWRRLGGRRGQVVPRPDWRAGAEMWQGTARGWAPPREIPEALLHGQPRRNYPGGTVFRGYERPESFPRARRSARGVPPDWRRYLGREEYGLGPDGAYDREFGGKPFRRGRLGARNALFGREGFVRYDREYDDQWW